MEKTAEFSLQKEAELPKTEKEYGEGEEAVKASFDVEQSAKDLSEFSGAVSTKLGEKNRVIDEVKADGVLSDEEKAATVELNEKGIEAFTKLEGESDEEFEKRHADNKEKLKAQMEKRGSSGVEYSDLEKQGMEGDRRDVLQGQIEELKDINAGKESVKTLQKERNSKEGDLVRLDLEIADLEEEIEMILDSLEAQKEQLAQELDQELIDLGVACEEDVEEIKREVKANIRKVAQTLKEDPTITAYREGAKKLREDADHLKFFGVDATEKIVEKRDEIKSDDEVMHQTATIKSQVDSIRDTVDPETGERIEGFRVKDRRARLVTDQAVARTEHEEAIEEANSHFNQEIEGVKQKLSVLEEQRSEAVMALWDLDVQIDDKQRLEESIKSLKVEMTQFDFSAAEKALADLEKRAANTLSLQALEADQKSLSESVEYALNKANDLVEDLALSQEAAEEAIKDAYRTQAEELKQQKDAELADQQEIHNELVRAINDPVAERLEEIQKRGDLREGQNAVDSALSLKRAMEAAEKGSVKIEKSAKALDKFKSKLESTFAKLNSKLSEAKGEAYSSVDSQVDSVSKDIDTAKTIAQEAKDGNFQAQGGWLKKTFKRLFAKN